MSTSMKTMEINLTRTIPATPAEVYDAWLDPQCPVNPFHGAKRLVFEPKVGSLYHFAHMQGEVERPHYGRFDVLEPGSRIRMTWMSNHTRGLESVVTVTFKPKGEGTLLTLNHANLPDDEMGRAHDDGWKYFIGLLEQRFATARA
ncbi:MAG TPA: SRPBCC domain-containing protein [Usitatibacter sp.]|nr:SRPBCC domain-containing protein [Usitatibacter sp.]